MGLLERNSGRVYCSFSSHSRLSPHAESRNARSVSRILGIGSTKDLGNFHGVPLIHGRVTQNTYRDIVDKVSSRLAGWKSRSKSLAGRATLVGSVTSAIPTYSMLTSRLPGCTIEAIDRLNRSFLWGGKEGKRGLR